MSTLVEDTNPKVPNPLALPTLLLRVVSLFERMFEEKTTGTVELTNQVGMKITIKIKSLDQAYSLMRTYGANGWTSGSIPDGGIVLPYEMNKNFDWRLIGGSEWTNPEGEVGVIYKGNFYKRRELDAVDTKKMKMGAAVKYSRGAKPSDSPHLKEGEEGSVQYITLALFRGKGRVIAGLQKPQ